MKAYLNVTYLDLTSLSVSGRPSGSASRSLYVPLFWYKYWNPEIWRHIRVLSPYMYLATASLLNVTSPSSSGLQVPDIIFIVRIEILTLTNLYLDIHEGIPECDLPISTWLSSWISLQQPPGARHYFYCKNWNPHPNKPTFIHTWRHT